MEIWKFGNLKMKIIFLSFGNSSYYRALNRIQQQAKSMNLFSDIICIRDTDIRRMYPEFWTKHGAFVQSHSRGYGYWIWKSFLVGKMLENEMEEGDVLVYADAGCILRNEGRPRMIEYIEKVNEYEVGMLVFQLTHAEKKYTKRDLFLHLQADTPFFRESNQIMATSFVMKKCDVTINFVKEWYDICGMEQYHYLTDSQSREGNNDLSFREHRHDQSIFSLLCKKILNENSTEKSPSNIFIVPDETYFLNFEKDGKKFPIHAKRCRS